MSRYAVFQAIQKLDPEKDHQRIVFSRPATIFHLIRSDVRVRAVQDFLRTEYRGLAGPHRGISKAAAKEV